MNEKKNDSIQDIIHSFSGIMSPASAAGDNHPDGDTLLILLVIFCLYRNDGDIKLILSLVYILL